MLSEARRWEVFERDGFRCQCCGVRTRLTVDHIHPRALGGGDELDNLRTLCRSCNSSKNVGPSCVLLVHGPAAPIRNLLTEEEYGPYIDRCIDVQTIEVFWRWPGQLEPGEVPV